MREQNALVYIVQHLSEIKKQIYLVSDNNH